jgi:hypothetical protein
VTYHNILFNCVFAIESSYLHGIVQEGPLVWNAHVMILKFLNQSLNDKYQKKSCEVNDESKVLTCEFFSSRIQLKKKTLSIILLSVYNGCEHSSSGFLRDINKTYQCRLEIFFHFTLLSYMLLII